MVTKKRLEAMILGLEHDIREVRGKVEEGRKIGSGQVKVNEWFLSLIKATNERISGIEEQMKKVEPRGWEVVGGNKK